MAINIELPDSEVPRYIEFLRTKIDAIDAEIKPFLDEKNTIQVTIDKLLKKGHPQPILKEIGAGLRPIAGDIAKQLYESNTTIIGKIVFILKESGKPMYTRQIIDRALELQPEIKKDAVELSKLSKNISTILSINQGIATSNKRFVRETDENNNYIFSLNPKYK